MPSWSLWTLGAVLAGVATLGIAGCKTVTVETVIHAKPAVVWRVLEDASGFETWNPVHVRVEGTFGEGETIRIFVKDGRGKVSSFASKVRRVVAERELVSLCCSRSRIRSVSSRSRVGPESCSASNFGVLACSSSTSTGWSRAIGR